MVRAVSELNIPSRRDFFAFRSDSDLAQIAAIRAGFGVGACQLGIARRDPNLVQVLPDLGFALELWVVMHEDLKASRRMRLMFDHLVGALSAYGGGKVRKPFTVSSLADMPGSRSKIRRNQLALVPVPVGTDPTASSI